MSQIVALPDRLSRREFLRLGGMSMLGLAAPAHWLGPHLDLSPPQLGRVLEERIDIYRRPSFSAIRIAALFRDDLITITEAVVGDQFPEHNRVWYNLNGRGYVHSSSIQPVAAQPNKPERSLPVSGALMEVTVPWADAYWEPKTEDPRAYRFYYSTTHWVTGLALDRKKRIWYRIYDDRIAASYYVQAESLRHIPFAEMTPISPEVPEEDKRIEVDLTNQWIQCFEKETLVYTARVSTGATFDNGEFWTPPGEFITFRKRGSRHMAAGNLASGYDLPGVPWVSYITQEGISFHGTYWHNDFGVPRSHGCINMTPQAAKWLFRWTRPTVPTHLDELWSDVGTQVTIRV
ncbi:MAG TPA: L,D-transpeptidase [Anaerolineales bacterium]|nr:L,D-transpeptidase [Anaerolineales bacterium]